VTKSRITSPRGTDYQRRSDSIKSFCASPSLNSASTVQRSAFSVVNVLHIALSRSSVWFRGRCQTLLFGTNLEHCSTPMQEGFSSTGRPKRSTRAPERIPQPKFTPAPTQPKKRKARELDPVDQLEHLLKSSTSALTTMNISVRVSVYLAQPW